MRILQICYRFTPRRLARNGGELRYWQNLTSLVALGHQLHLVLCNVNDDLEPEVRQLTDSIQYVQGSIREITRLGSWRTLIDDEAALQFYLPGLRGLPEQVAKIALRVQPDLIWADWIGTMALVPNGLPVVYSHHDFHYKISTVRAETQGRDGRWPDRIRRFRLRRAELSLCAKADHVVCVSASERKQLMGIGPTTSYIPIVGPTIVKPANLVAQKGRIFLFGSWACSAMRSASRHFRKTIWPLMSDKRPDLEWHQIGEPEPRNTEDWQWVQKSFVCHGFEGDLSRVFRIGDASLIPYEKDTGFRAKFVTAAGYGVINIGYEQTFHCAPEFTEGQDCLVARSPSEMVEVLRQYAEDANLRRRLGEASRALYETAFSFEAQLPKYEQVLANSLR